MGRRILLLVKKKITQIITVIT